MTRKKLRREREARTLRTMIAMRCARLHRPGAELCPECESLLAYSLKRLAACPDGEAKPVCGRCQRHCYRPAERASIREVMAWSGPRILLRHPLMALGHLRDSLRRDPRK